MNEWVSELENDLCNGLIVSRYRKILTSWKCWALLRWKSNFEDGRISGSMSWCQTTASDCFWLILRVQSNIRICTHIYSYATCTLTVQSVKVHKTERTPKKTTTEKPYVKLRGINTCHGNVICILYFICASHRQQQSSKMRGFNFWQERNMRLQMCVSLNIQRAMLQVLPVQNATVFFYPGINFIDPERKMFINMFVFRFAVLELS